MHACMRSTCTSCCPARPLHATASGCCFKFLRLRKMLQAVVTAFCGPCCAMQTSRAGHAAPPPCCARCGPGRRPAALREFHSAGLAICKGCVAQIKRGRTVPRAPRTIWHPRAPSVPARRLRRPRTIAASGRGGREPPPRVRGLGTWAAGGGGPGPASVSQPT